VHVAEIEAYSRQRKLESCQAVETLSQSCAELSKWPGTTLSPMHIGRRMHVVAACVAAVESRSSCNVAQEKDNIESL
jgi:hypothetical protein